MEERRRDYAVTDVEFEHWVAAYSDGQIRSLRSLRTLILKHTVGLGESINSGKWLTNYLFYSANSKMVYAIGPIGKSKTTLHMMPYYGSEVLQQKHGEALSPFLTGKSCIAFLDFSDLPINTLKSIFEVGTPAFLKAFAT